MGSSASKKSSKAKAQETPSVKSPSGIKTFPSTQPVKEGKESKSRTKEKEKSKKRDKEPEFSKKKAEEFYHKYADPEDTDVIDADGIYRLCKDLDVKPEDVSMLILSWQMGAEEMGMFTKEEFLAGLTKLGVDTLSKLKAKMSSLPKVLSNPSTFKEIYEYAFLFAKEAEQRSIEIATAVALIELLLPTAPFSAEFREFLQEQTSYKVVNKDQWRSFLEFSTTIDAKLSSYTAEGCWPVLLDEFAEWYAERHPLSEANKTTKETDDFEDLELELEGLS